MRAGRRRRTGWLRARVISFGAARFRQAPRGLRSVRPDATAAGSRRPADRRTTSSPSASMTRFPPPEVVIRPPGRTPAVMGADPKTVLRRAGHQDRRPQSPAPLRETEPRAGAVHETRDRSRGSHPRVLWCPYFDKITAPRASRMMPPLIGTPGTGSKARARGRRRPASGPPSIRSSVFSFTFPTATFVQRCPFFPGTPPTLHGPPPGARSPICTG